MPVEMRMWRIDGGQPRPLGTAVLPTEAALEDFLEQDPSLLGTRLLVIGRQVRTPHGKFIDLLAMDADGNLHVLELKRDKTPATSSRRCSTTAPGLTRWYGSRSSTLPPTTWNHPSKRPSRTSSAVLRPTSSMVSYSSRSWPPTSTRALSASSLTCVSSASPVNAVFFSYLEDDDRRYLARSWLANPDQSTIAATPRANNGKRADWNGRDWFVSFGD